MSLSATNGSCCLAIRRITPPSAQQVCSDRFGQTSQTGSQFRLVELGAFAKLEPEFTKRGVKLIGLSANTVDSHGGWIKDIDEISGSKLRFPIIGDKERKVAYLYDMLDHQDTTNVDQKGIAFTIRSVFIVDPKKAIRLIMSYPASTGRNAAEVLRVVDSLQTGDRHRVTTPINWVPGEDN